MNPLPELLHADLCFSHSYSSRVHSETNCGLEHSMSSVREGQFKAKLWPSCLWKSSLCEIFLQFLEIRLVQLVLYLFKKTFNFPVQFPYIWGKGEIFYLFFLSYFMAHCIFCSMHLISFSLKWKNVSRVIFLTFLVCQFHMMLCSLLYLLDLFSVLTFFYLSMRSTEGTIAEKNDWE